MPHLILASTSPRRRHLLQTYGFKFEVLTTSVEELQDATLGPSRLVQENARLKAMPVADLHTDSVVIGCDTVVALGDRILGKPVDMREAAQMLADLNGRTHTVHSGVCIVHSAGQREISFVETTQVRFHHLSDAERFLYHERIHPLDKAGAYAAQDDDGQLIAESIGSMTNVVGLPMEALIEKLKLFGISPEHPH